MREPCFADGRDRSRHSPSKIALSAVSWANGRPAVASAAISGSRSRLLVSPSFTARRAERLRPRIAAIVDALLDELGGQAGRGAADLMAGFARLLPIDVICDLVGERPGLIATYCSRSCE
jgi:cytochrome P450